MCLLCTSIFYTLIILHIYAVKHIIQIKKNNNNNYYANAKYTKKR